MINSSKPWATVMTEYYEGKVSMRSIFLLWWFRFQCGCFFHAMRWEQSPYHASPLLLLPSRRCGRVVSSALTATSWETIEGLQGTNLNSDFKKEAQWRLEKEVKSEGKKVSQWRIRLFIRAFTRNSFQFRVWGMKRRIISEKWNKYLFHSVLGLLASM